MIPELECFNVVLVSICYFLPFSGLFAVDWKFYWKNFYWGVFLSWKRLIDHCERF